jgi:hypothetical protein
MYILQCPSGQFSSSNASSCIACSAGKYLTNVAGRTEEGSCTNVSIKTHEFLHVFEGLEHNNTFQMVLDAQS